MINYKEFRGKNRLVPDILGKKEFFIMALKSYKELMNERRILGGLLRGGAEAFRSLPPSFGVDCFQVEQHQWIFQAMEIWYISGKSFTEKDITRQIPNLATYIWYLSGLTVGDFHQDAVDLVRNTCYRDEESSSPMEYVRASDLVKTPPEERKYLIEGILPEQSLCFLAGPEGVGKSIFALNLGHAITSGKTEFLNWKI